MSKQPTTIEEGVGALMMRYAEDLVHQGYDVRAVTGGNGNDYEVYKAKKWHTITLAEALIFHRKTNQVPVDKEGVNVNFEPRRRALR